MATARKTVAETDEPPVVFVSYSKHDKVWKDRLLVHLGVLETAGLISVWSDDDIDEGGEWLPPLVKAMKNASVAVCLISSNYLNTKFCVKDEIPYLLERAEKEGLHLLFFMVTSVDYAAHQWLRERQLFLPKGQCVEIDFEGKEDLPFSWLAKDIRERLGEHVREQEKPGVSSKIRDVIAALEADAASRPEPEPMPAVEIIEPAFPALPLSLIDIGRLPETGDELFGRQAELQLLDQAWEADGTNIVAFRAWGGVGKSTLVNTWTERLARDNYRGAERVFAWSFYSQGTRDRVTSADAFIDEALRFFEDDDPSKGSAWAKGERLAELVGDKKALLLLDGMEPLQDKYQGIKDPALARLVACLAVKNAGLCVITTREDVKELDDFPDNVIAQDLEQISPEAGRALLRVREVRGSDADLEQASRDFGNHALAVNLLATYLTRFADGDIARAETIPDLHDVDEKDGKHPRRVMAAFAEQFGEGPELDLLHVMGLFDRPADKGCIAALRKPPAIPGLTDHLVQEEGGKLSTWISRALGRSATPSSEDVWEQLLAYLRDIGLLAPESHHAPDELDAHPLVREHFGARLRAGREKAWKAGHERLYEHLKGQAEHRPDTLAAMAPLFQAVHHGCQAGRRQEAYDEIYRARIRRQGEFYLVHKLGAFGADLGLVASFFDPPFAHPAADLTEANRAWLLNTAAFHLRALGRLGEAVAPMRVSMEMDVEREEWEGAARSASNLSGLKLTLGEVAAAVASGEAAIEHADRSGDDWQMFIVTRTVLADARHQAGDVAAAQALFEEAEAMQAEDQPGYPRLYSLAGYRYCELLLTLGQAEAVRERAVQTLEWMTNDPNAPLLTVALDHLSLGRAALALGDRDEARRRLDQAVDGLREAGTIHHIPRGLLARAALFRESDADLARKDLDEAMRIAERCSMRLHECDAHLEYTRLEIKQGQPDAARGHVKSAAKLVEDCGYHRRDAEVADLKKELGL